ncbi:hypothetical protein [Actinomadura bangladeshensis]|uniref:Uncharacterized protein n=1 Tax=Actinomadura bangladeshensis TaxID=453573 RepID=A0A6L9QUS9_9ACTN|nr:hypothetical protein [Actinomadura bangladeshensis]NEA28363.1 hypothetical protein [Actinomadura bangladeshensis]
MNSVAPLVPLEPYPVADAVHVLDGDVASDALGIGHDLLADHNSVPSACRTAPIASAAFELGVACPEMG